MKSIERTFEFLKKGGICVYDTNYILTLDECVDNARITSDIYRFDGTLLFLTCPAELSIDFTSPFDSNNIYQLNFIISLVNTGTVDLTVSWTATEYFGPEYEYNLTVTKSFKADTPSSVNIDLREATGWRGLINNLTITVSGTNSVYIHDLLLLSNTYSCTNTNCVFYSKYEHPCVGSLYRARYFAFPIDVSVQDPSVSLVVNETYYTTTFSGSYTKDTIIEELNKYFSTLPFGATTVYYTDQVVIETVVEDFDIKYCTVFELLGMFDSTGNPIYDFEVTPYLPSSYIDVAGNDIFVQPYTGTLSLTSFASIGADPDLLTLSEKFNSYEGKTVLYKACVSDKTGVFTKLKFYAATYQSPKLLIYRRYGSKLRLLSSTDLPSNTTGTLTVDCYVYLHKGDVLAFYDVGIPVTVEGKYIIDYIYTEEGIPNTISVDKADGLVYTPIPVYLYLELPRDRIVPIELFSNKDAYIDTIYIDTPETTYSNFIIYNWFTVNTYKAVAEVVDSSLNKTLVRLDLDVTSDITDIISFKLPSLNIKYIRFLDLEFDIVSKAQVPIATIDLVYTNTPLLKDRALFEIYTVVSGTRQFEANIIPDYLYTALPPTSHILSSVNVEVPTVEWHGVITDNIDGLYCILHDAASREYDGSGVFPSTISITTKLRTPNILEYIFITNNTFSTTGDTIYVGKTVGTLNLAVRVKRDVTITLPKIVSSFVPDKVYTRDNDVVLYLYNTKIAPLRCIVTDVANKLWVTDIYKFKDADNYTIFSHPELVFLVGSFSVLHNAKFYRLTDLLYLEHYFVTKEYTFKTPSLDWFVPYDIVLSAYDGEFIIDNGLYIRPITNTAVRWYNFIYSNLLEGPSKLELEFEFFGNVYDFFALGFILYSYDYDKYIRVTCDITQGSVVTVEINEGESEFSVYSIYIGFPIKLVLEVNESTVDISVFIDGNYKYITSINNIVSTYRIAVTTTYNGSGFAGTKICKINKIVVNSNKVITGGKGWYTLNDGITFNYCGNVFSNLPVHVNVGKDLVIDTTVKISKLVYTFPVIKTKYIKLTPKSELRITEIVCYSNESKLAFKGLATYNCNSELDSLDISISFLNDKVVIDDGRSVSIDKCKSGVLSAVGVEFEEQLPVDRIEVYYVDTGQSIDLELYYSYDNTYYLPVYHNFNLYPYTADRLNHYLFNEFTQATSTVSLVRYDAGLREEASVDFTVTCPAETYKWKVNGAYSCNNGLVMEGGSYVESVCKFSGDLDVSIFFYDLLNYASGEYLTLTIKDSNNKYSSIGFGPDGAVKVTGDLPYFSGLISTNRNYRGGLRLEFKGTTLTAYNRTGFSTWAVIRSATIDFYKDPLIVTIKAGSVNGTVRLATIECKGDTIYSNDVYLLDSYFSSSPYVAAITTTDATTSLAVIYDSFNTSLIADRTLSFIAGFNSSTNYILYKLYDFYIKLAGGRLYCYVDSIVPSEYLIGDVLTNSTVSNFVGLSVFNNTSDEFLQPTSDTVVSFGKTKPRYFVVEKFDDDVLDNFTILGNPGTLLRKGVYKFYGHNVIKYTNTVPTSEGLEVFISGWLTSIVRSGETLFLMIAEEESYPVGSYDTCYGDTNRTSLIGLCCTTGGLTIQVEGISIATFDISTEEKFAATIRVLNNKLYIRIVSSTGKLYVDSQPLSRVHTNLNVWIGPKTGQVGYAFGNIISLSRILIGQLNTTVLLDQDPYKEVYLTEEFSGSDGRLPDTTKWYYTGEPRTKSGALVLKAYFNEGISTKYKLIPDYSVKIRLYNLAHTTTLYAGVYIKLNYGEDGSFKNITHSDYVFIGYVNTEGVECNIQGNTSFTATQVIDPSVVEITTASGILSITHNNTVVYTEPYLAHPVELEIRPNIVGTSVSVDYVRVNAESVVSEYYPVNYMPYYWPTPNVSSDYCSVAYFEYAIKDALPFSSAFSADLVLYSGNFVWDLVIFGDVVGDFNVDIVDPAGLEETIAFGGIFYIGEHVYTIDASNITITKPIILIGVGKVSNIVLRIVNGPLKFYTDFSLYNVTVDSSNYSGSSFTTDKVLDSNILFWNVLFKVSNYVTVIGSDLSSIQNISVTASRITITSPIYAFTSYYIKRVYRSACYFVGETQHWDYYLVDYVYEGGTCPEGFGIMDTPLYPACYIGSFNDKVVVHTDHTVELEAGFRHYYFAVINSLAGFSLILPDGSLLPTTITLDTTTTIIAGRLALDTLFIYDKVLKTNVFADRSNLLNSRLYKLGCYCNGSYITHTLPYVVDTEFRGDVLIKHSVSLDELVIYGAPKGLGFFTDLYNSFYKTIHNDYGSIELKPVNVGFYLDLTDEYRVYSLSLPVASTFSDIGYFVGSDVENLTEASVYLFRWFVETSPVTGTNAFTPGTFVVKQDFKSPRLTEYVGYEGLISFKRSLSIHYSSKVYETEDYTILSLPASIVIKLPNTVAVTQLIFDTGYNYNGEARDIEVLVNDVTYTSTLRAQHDRFSFDTPKYTDTIIINILTATDFVDAVDNRSFAGCVVVGDIDVLGEWLSLDYTTSSCYYVELDQVYTNVSVDVDTGSLIYSSECSLPDLIDTCCSDPFKFCLYLDPQLWEEIRQTNPKQPSFEGCVLSVYTPNVYTVLSTTKLIGDFGVIVKLEGYDGGTATTGNTAGLVFYDDDNVQQIRLVYNRATSSNVRLYSLKADYSTSVLRYLDEGYLSVFRVRDVVYFYVSGDGVSWDRLIPTWTYRTTTSPLRVGLDVSSNTEGELKFSELTIYGSTYSTVTNICGYQDTMLEGSTEILNTAVWDITDPNPIASGRVRFKSGYTYIYKNIINDGFNIKFELNSFSGSGSLYIKLGRAILTISNSVITYTRDTITRNLQISGRFILHLHYVKPKLTIKVLSWPGVVWSILVEDSYVIQTSTRLIFNVVDLECNIVSFWHYDDICGLILDKNDHVKTLAITSDKPTVQLKGVYSSINTLLFNDFTNWLVFGDVSYELDRYFATDNNAFALKVKGNTDTIVKIYTRGTKLSYDAAVGILDVIVVKLFTTTAKVIKISFGKDEAKYTWTQNISAGYTTLELKQNDSTLEITRYGKVDSNLLFSEVDISTITVEGSLLKDEVFVLRGLVIKSVAETLMLSSSNDSISVPLIVSTNAYRFRLYYEPYWDEYGRVFGKYLIDKYLISILGSSFSISLSHTKRGSFALSLISEDGTFKQYYTRSSKGFILQGVNKLDITILNEHWPRISVFVNETLFFDVIVKQNTFSCSEVLIGGRVFDTHKRKYASLCGKLIDLSVTVSNNTEFKVVDTNYVLVELNGSYVPLAQVAPLDLGVVDPGGKKEIKLRTQTKLYLDVEWIKV